MIKDKTKDWENIYRTQGIVQSGILKTAVTAIDKCRSRNVKTILDLGCGTGRHTVFLAQNGFETYACDISQTGLYITESRLKENNLNAHLSKNDFRNLNFPDEYFDAIICLWVSGHGHKNDVNKHISEMFRAVKTNGLVFCDFISIDDDSFGKGTQIEHNTFINNDPLEAGIPHHFSTYEELTQSFQLYSNINISRVEYHVGDSNDTKIKAFFVEAIK